MTSTALKINNRATRCFLTATALRCARFQALRIEIIAKPKVRSTFAHEATPRFPIAAGPRERYSNRLTIIGRLGMGKLALLCGAALLSAVVGAAAGESDLAGQEIHIGVAGPLTTSSATFGVEMRQAVDLAVDERNAVGGVLGAKIVAE